MKIKELDITAYGKLSDMNIVLNDGLNVVYGTNESGKSTLCSFIETMFYGFPERANSKDSPRAKYVPWGKDSASGSMTVEHNGEYITVFRQSGRSYKYDREQFYPENAGFKKLIPGHDAYKKSVFCGENGASLFGSNEEIDKKLINIASSGEENSSIQAAIKILSDKRKSLTSKSGRLSNLKAEAEKLNGEYLAASKMLKSTEENNLKIASLKKDYASLLSEYKALSSISHTDYTPLEAEVIEKKQLIDSLPSLSRTSPVMSRLVFPIFIFSIICSLSMFIIGFLTQPLLMAFSPLPFLFGLIYFSISHTRTKRKQKEFFKSAGCESLSDYNALLEKKKNLIEEYNSLLNEQTALVREQAIKNAERESNIKRLTDKLLSLQRETALLETENAKLHCRPLSEIESDLSYYNNLIRETELKVKALEKAAEYITSARLIVSRDFTPLINEKAQKYISLVAPKAGRSVSMKEDFSFFITDPSPQDISGYSTGYREEVYICYRLALSEILFPESFPVILDNPFASSDDFREKALIDLLLSISEHRQVILFTNRKNLYFNQINCNMVDITPKNDV